ncbi:hypothetical protein PMKS-003242 [Pichia membranifaciens]|uniref:Uncharacterized protein n=1 Tax=Pichia membranifaciens TaxID=4926 RepID=A0A1Q2YJM8_9ASCO|nr:hypothetical protein PMKS-003242 [Pichia membranifaciens]
MILTLISRYARRTEIKNISLDSNIFVSEFRKTSLEMMTLLDKMMSALRDMHNQWTLIVTEGKDNEFSKEILREKLRERVNNDKDRRLKVLFENQKEMKAQMEHLRASSLTPGDVNNGRNRLATRRVSSIGTIGSIDENSSLNTNSGLSQTQKKLTRRLSVSETPSRGSASASPSLTSSSRSPFYRQNSNSNLNSIANSNSNGSVSASTSRSNSVEEAEGDDCDTTAEQGEAGESGGQGYGPFEILSPDQSEDVPLAGAMLPGDADRGSAPATP